ncbi:NAD(P)H-dependent oxidoreductase [Dietzia sp. CQ4]|nr:NAD(P)H-dependent oxidoreductase [Dietzia sp. CQ4]
MPSQEVTPPNPPTTNRQPDSSAPHRETGDALRIGIVVGSTRPGRKAEAVSGWVHEAASRRGDAQFKVLDLADFGLPLLDEPAPPISGQITHEHTRVWSSAVGACDGFVFITPEYNHSTSGALKNAIDFLYAEWNDKACGFVSYGVDGGIRAVEHLRVIAAELKLADVRTQVGLSLSAIGADGVRADARAAQQLSSMLDETVAWSEALRQLRSAAVA